MRRGVAQMEAHCVWDAGVVGTSSDAVGVVSLVAVALEPSGGFNADRLIWRGAGIGSAGVVGASTLAVTVPASGTASSMVLETDRGISTLSP